MKNFYFTLEGEKQSYSVDKFGLDHKNATGNSWSEHEVLDIVLTTIARLIIVMQFLIMFN